MEETVYQKLAQRLDAIPNGFPATESGVELALLAKLFTPEEAALAAHLHLMTRSAEEIAQEAGQDPDETLQLLKGMARKGLIRFRRKDGQLRFALIPFVVGFFEEQLPRMGEELARLFERYRREALAQSALSQPPAIHRVIPVGEAIPSQLEVLPYESASHLVEQAKSWGVRDCICRVQQRFLGQGCHHPIENCLMLAPVENAFDGHAITKPISKGEAFRILQEAEEVGLVHCPGNYRDGIYYICNCCTCGCAVLRSVAEFNLPNIVAHSDFRAVVNRDLCAGCETCLERCQFNALTVVDFVCRIDTARCMGCGLCVTTCPEGALTLERRPAGEALPVPQDIKYWMVEKAISRGLALQDIL